MSGSVLSLVVAIFQLLHNFKKYSSVLPFIGVVAGGQVCSCLLLNFRLSYCWFKIFFSKILNFGSKKT